MEERTKKFRMICQNKRNEKSAKILKDVFNLEKITQKDVIRLANGHELPNDIRAEKNKNIESKFEKMKKLDKIKDNDDE